jgi:predicted RNA-binding Zn-ribbon protein involved in translation (DUF1610 family)
MIENGMAERVRRGFKAFIRVAASVFVLSGLAMLLATSGSDHLLIETDPLFGLTNRTCLLIGGLFHSALGGLLLARVDLMQRGAFTLWAGWCHAVYFAGMMWMKKVAPFPLVRLVGWKIGANDPWSVNFFWKLFILYLVLGSLVYLVLERRRRRRLDVELFLNKWKSEREQLRTMATAGPNNQMLVSESSAKVVSVSQLPNSEDSLIEARSTELRFACPNCGQHIKCSEEYAGRQVKCPACQKPIQVAGESKTGGKTGLTRIDPDSSTTGGDCRPCRPV